MARHPWVAKADEGVRFAVQLPVRPEEVGGLVETARLVEGLGYDGLFIFDHPAEHPDPWVLLSGKIVARWLLPGAVACGILMAIIRPAAEVWLPWALDVSSERYGPIGMAFTYLAWLYVVAFVFIGSAVLGQVVVSDEGRAGAWLRGEPGSPPEHDVRRRDADENRDTGRSVR